MARVDEEVQTAVTATASARRVLVLTGAGISTDAGIPDFRGPNGVWTKNPAAERASDLDTYLRDPAVRRAAWQTRLTSPIWDAQPAPGHRALVDLEAAGLLEAIVTQNIDGLHLKAGSSPERVFEVHGSVRGWVCWRCKRTGPMGEMLERVRAGEDDPPCPFCGGIVKSTTISFGQQLDQDVLEAAVEATLACDCIWAVGSTLGVHPVAGLVPVAARHAPLVIVNADPTPYDDLASAIVRTPIAESLPAIVAGVVAAAV